MTIAVEADAYTDKDLEEMVDEDIANFDKFFQGSGTPALSMFEKAAIKTYLHWKTHGESEAQGINELKQVLDVAEQAPVQGPRAPVQDKPDMLQAEVFLVRRLHHRALARQGAAVHAARKWRNRCYVMLTYAAGNEILAVEAYKTRVLAVLLNVGPYEADQGVEWVRRHDCICAVKELT